MDKWVNYWQGFRSRIERIYGGIIGRVSEAGYRGYMCELLAGFRSRIEMI